MANIESPDSKQAGIMSHFISRETRDEVPLHSNNVPFEDSRLCKEAAVDSRLGSLPSSARQSVWRLKFPANLLTVPDMGRLQWSQIIRMSFSFVVETRHRIRRTPG